MVGNEFLFILQLFRNRDKGNKSNKDILFLDGQLAEGADGYMEIIIPGQYASVIRTSC